MIAYPFWNNVLRHSSQHQPNPTSANSSPEHNLRGALQGMASAHIIDFLLGRTAAIDNSGLEPLLAAF
jgi:hypothetical protein